jgi:hypothetical protein
MTSEALCYRGVGGEFAFILGAELTGIYLVATTYVSDRVTIQLIYSVIASSSPWELLILLLT